MTEKAGEKENGENQAEEKKKKKGKRIGF